MVSEWWWVVSWKRVGQMGQGKWWVNGGGWWAGRQRDKCERGNCEWMVVTGELIESGKDGTGEMVGEWWWVVSWKRVGQIRLEKRSREIKNTQFLLGSLRRRGSFGDLDLDELLQTARWTGHKGYNSICLLSRKIKFFLFYTRSAMEQICHWRL